MFSEQMGARGTSAHTTRELWRRRPWVCDCHPPGGPDLASLGREGDERGKVCRWCGIKQACPASWLLHDSSLLLRQFALSSLCPSRHGQHPQDVPRRCAGQARRSVRGARHHHAAAGARRVAHQGACLRRVPLGYGAAAGLLRAIVSRPAAHATGGGLLMSLAGLPFPSSRAMRPSAPSLASAKT